MLSGTENQVTALRNTITSLVLCCVLVDPVVVALTWLHYQKTSVKREVYRQILAGIDKDDLILLKFSIEEARTQLRWEHAHEFEYNRKMYDVVERQMLGDCVYYWCWPDHRETMLKMRLDELTAQTFGKDYRIRDYNERLLSLLMSLYGPVFFNWQGFTPAALNQPVGSWFDAYVSITIQPPSPPPEFG
jgi:hypothetical protein